MSLTDRGGRSESHHSYDGRVHRGRTSLLGSPDRTDVSPASTVKRVRVKSAHRYASEALIVSVHKNTKQEMVWFDRTSLTAEVPRTMGIVMVQAKTARKLAQWILDNTKEEK